MLGKLAIIGWLSITGIVYLWPKHSLKTMKQILLLLTAMLILSGLFAQKTSISKSWRDPETQVKMGQFGKILVVAFVKNPANRKIVEDDIIKILKSKAMASYQLLGEGKSTLTDEELAEKIKNGGFDAAIVMRLIDPEKEIEYTPGTGTYPASYESFYPYYDGSAMVFNDPEYMSKHDVYAVESNFYSLKTNKLIWSSITTSIDPKNVDKMVASIGKLISSEMKKQGFLY